MKKSKEVIVGLRLSEDVLDVLNRIMARMQKQMPLIRITRSNVIRAAISAFAEHK